MGIDPLLYKDVIELDHSNMEDVPEGISHGFILVSSLPLIGNRNKRQEIVQWCLERFGGSGYGASYFFQNRNDTFNYQMVWFKDQTQAMEFKLRWV